MPVYMCVYLCIHVYVHNVYIWIVCVCACVFVRACMCLYPCSIYTCIIWKCTITCTVPITPTCNHCIDNSWFWCLCIFRLWAMPAFILKRQILMNLPSDKLEVEVAHSIDFMVERVSTVSHMHIHVYILCTCIYMYMYNYIHCSKFISCYVLLDSWLYTYTCTSVREIETNYGGHTWPLNAKLSQQIIF